MTFSPMLSQMLPHSGVVLPICSREVQYVVIYLYIVWVISTVMNIIPIYSLFCVDDGGFIIAFLRRVTCFRLQLIIQENDLGSPFQYLRAGMP